MLLATQASTLAFLAIFSGGAAIIAVVVWLIGRHRQQELSLTAQFDSIELGGIPLDGDVKFFGTAHAGTSGLLSSPITNSPCVWHRMVITEYEEREVTETDSEGNTTTRTETSSHVVYDHSSADNILMRDPRGGVYLLPDNIDFKKIPQTYSQRQDDFSLPELDLSFSTGFREWLVVEEYALPEGTSAMILAQVGQDQNGTRFLYDAKKARHSFLQPAQSPEQFAEDAAKNYKLRSIFAAVFVALAAACSGLYFFLPHGS